MGWFLFLCSAAWLSQVLVDRRELRRDRDQIRTDYNDLVRRNDALERELSAITTELNSPTATLLRSIVYGGRLPGSAREVTMTFRDGSSHVVNSNGGRFS